MFKTLHVSHIRMTEEDTFSIWTEKYRPGSFDEIVGQEAIIRRVKHLVDKENLPHLLFAGPPGVGKCVTGDTPLLLGDGRVVSMKDAVDNDEDFVQSLQADGTIQKQKIAYTYVDDADETIRIEMNNGGEVVVTPEHPFLVLKDGVPTWTEAQHISEDDVLATPSSLSVKDARQEDIFIRPELGDGDYVNIRQTDKAAIKPIDTIDEFFAELLGFLTCSDEFKFEHEHRELRNSFCNLVREVFGESLNIKEYEGSRKQYVEITHPETLLDVYPFLESKEKIIGKILEQPDNLVGSYIKGIMQARGSWEGKQFKINIPCSIHAQLTYIFRRYSVDACINKDTFTLPGDKANHLITILGLDFEKKRVRESNTKIALAKEHLEPVFNTLGIEPYEFPTRISKALDNSENVSDNTAKYVYRQVLELSQKRMKKGLNYINHVESLDFEPDNPVGSISAEAEKDKIKKKVSKHIAKGRKEEYLTKKRDVPSDVINQVKALTRTHNADKEYKQILKKATLTDTVSEILTVYNITPKEVQGVTTKVPVNVVYDALKQSMSLQTVSNLESLVLAVKEVLVKRLFSEDLVRSLELIRYLSQAHITWVPVTKTESAGPKKVYDLNVEKTHSFIAGTTPIINHNTTLSLVVAKELYGETWRQNFLELNASDERGIDIVREKVKNFARTQSLGDVPFKIIYLDESDALTSDAQQALRRTMENYTRSCRFILSCNYSSKIIDPIQSRCTIFRFRNLDADQINKIIDRVCKAEGLTVTEDAREALFFASNGDVRRLENILQTSASFTDEIDADVVYDIASYADPDQIKDILDDAINNNFKKAKKALLKAKLKQGLSGVDVVKQFQREIWELDIPDKKKLSMIKQCAETEFRLVEGADEHIQLDALLAHFTA